MSFITEKTIWEHIKDLRTYLMWAVGIWLLTSVGISFFGDQILDFVLRPMNGQDLFFNSPQGPMFFLFKVFGFGGLVVSLPIQIWLIWRFVAPAMDQKEQSFGIFYILAVCVLSLIGILYSYYSLVPVSLKFLLQIAPKGTRSMLTVGEYIDFLTMMLVIAVAIFQTPVLVFGLIRTRLVHPSAFVKHRKVVYFGVIVLLTAFLPPDLFALFMTAIPVILLYEASIFLGKFTLGKEERKEKLKKVEAEVEELKTEINVEINMEINPNLQPQV